MKKVEKIEEMIELGKIYCEDCLETMKRMPDKSVDLIVTDPPWMDYKTSWYDASSWHAPVVWLSPDKYAPELFRILSHGSCLILWCRWDVFEAHAIACKEAGFRVANCIVWAKPNHTAGDLDGNLGNKHEMAIFAVKGLWKRTGKREVNLWEEGHLFSRGFRNHPTEKPVHLMERCIRLGSCVNYVVYDPFMGSGTTAVACERLGRKWVGSEINPDYVKIAEKRIAAERAQTKMEFM
jgi:site-specific DNA-methyltransferase (adenine-specific)